MVCDWSFRWKRKGLQCPPPRAAGKVFYLFLLGRSQPAVIRRGFIFVRKGCFFFMLISFCCRRTLRGQLENAAPLFTPLNSSLLLIPSPHSQTLTHVIPRQSQSCDLNCEQRGGLAEKSSRESPQLLFFFAVSFLLVSV